LLNNERIALIIAVTGTIDGSPSRQQNANQSFWENSYLNSYGNYKNFTIVNRNYLKNNLDEITLSRSGLMSRETTVRIGELTGATHLLFIDVIFYSGFFVGGSMTVHKKLVDIKTGQILAIDEMEVVSFL